jgi:putative phage-type endonuclease
MSGCGAGRPKEGKLSPQISTLNFIRIRFRDRHSWLEGRQQSIGASEAASVQQISPWVSNIHLWELKTGRRQAEDISEKPAVKRGIEEEPKIRAEFIAAHPEFLVDHHPYDILLHKDHPFVSATLDGEIFEIETGRRGVLEIKTGSYSTKRYLSAWTGGEVPDHYFAQVCQQLLVTGWDFAIVQAKLFRTDRTYSDGSTNGYLPETYETSFYIEASDPIVQESIQATLDADIAFWDCVEKNRMPWTSLKTARKGA